MCNVTKYPWVCPICRKLDGRFEVEIEAYYYCKVNKDGDCVCHESGDPIHAEHDSISHHIDRGVTCLDCGKHFDDVGELEGAVLEAAHNAHVSEVEGATPQETATSEMNSEIEALKKERAELLDVIKHLQDAIDILIKDGGAERIIHLLR